MKIPPCLQIPALFVAALATAIHSTPPRLANVEHHWLANTGGSKTNHIANFLTDMVVWYPHNWQLPEKIVLTASFWDEGSCGFCSYSEGKQIGKAEWFKDTIHSDRAWRSGKKCAIGNLWGRNFLHNEGAPPRGDSAPFVACDDHDTLRSVVDPTAVAFDMAGNLLVADNGPDQDVKIFSLASKPLRLVRTFGDSGGVFAGPVPGRVGIRRFWGIRGLGVDSEGNVYVGNTGIPEQTMGGTDIRVFSGKDSSLLWQVQGLAFVNTADADPASDGQDLYLDAKRFRMDYAREPGSSWKETAVTLDPFRFPNDPRLTTPMGSIWVRRIGGKRFQFQTNMRGGFVNVVRFEEGSEIGIPTAFFCNADRKTGWGSDSAPTWERSETNKRIRWYWVDRNGDGIAQKAEFGTYENWNIYNEDVNVDDAGDIWFGGTGDTSTYFRGGGVTRIRAGALDFRGIPAFRVDSIGRYGVPYKAGQGGAVRVKHLAAGDVMFLGQAANAWFFDTIHVVRNFTDKARRAEVCTIDAGYDAQGQTEIHLDRNTAPMTLPIAFSADSEYVYVAHLDAGRYSRARGEIAVYDARTCQPVGWMAPDSLEGNFSGAVDMVEAVNVVVQADGHRIVLEEEDGAGKVLAFRWCPDGAPCAKGTSPVRRGTGATPAWRIRHGFLEVAASAGSRLEMRDIRGAAFFGGATVAAGETGWSRVPLRRSGMVVIRLHEAGGTRSWTAMVP